MEDNKSDHPLFNRWHGMKSRCNRVTHKSYFSYGGRGIKVCNRWNDSFDAFLEDMESSFKDGLELDRENNDGDYTPENCRWVTRKTNAANITTNNYVETPHGLMHLTQISEFTDIKKFTVYARWRRGARTWDELTAPPETSRGARIETPFGMLNLPEISKKTGIKLHTLYGRRKAGKVTWDALT